MNPEFMKIKWQPTNLKTVNNQQNLIKRNKF